MCCLFWRHSQAPYFNQRKYIIVKPNKDGSIKELSINGTITDPNSNEPLSDASIYVKKHKILVNSDKKGRFAFNVPSSAKQVKINIAKENYLDTSVVIVASRSQTLHIKNAIVSRQRISEFDSLTKRVADWFLNKQYSQHSRDRKV
ncbi:MAG: carboxypeptidase-like regulatory domain-containing protein [Saprospiraceae bacterium]|nr:carboxypeptidase-like regulatory domain-containing protein [Saprospiraceae bacterium]